MLKWKWNEKSKEKDYLLFIFQFQENLNIFLISYNIVIYEHRAYSDLQPQMLTFANYVLVHILFLYDSNVRPIITFHV